mmetsp:Transcript_37546/g.88257  ORF Transcript_37546/g.88257 Transcript_37546/m.88257 type:complete len:226 (-) Transcript_37546:435-1112(-)
MTDNVRRSNHGFRTIVRQRFSALRLSMRSHSSPSSKFFLTCAIEYSLWYLPKRPVECCWPSFSANSFSAVLRRATSGFAVTCMFRILLPLSDCFVNHDMRLRLFPRDGNAALASVLDFLGVLEALAAPGTIFSKMTDSSSLLFKLLSSFGDCSSSSSVKLFLRLLGEAARCATRPVSSGAVDARKAFGAAGFCRVVSADAFAEDVCNSSGPTGVPKFDRNEMLSL